MPRLHSAQSVPGCIGEPDQGGNLKHFLNLSNFLEGFDTSLHPSNRGAFHCKWPLDSHMQTRPGVCVAKCWCAKCTVSAAQPRPGECRVSCQTGAAPCLVLTVYLLPGGNTAPGILMGYPDRICGVSGANLTVCLLPGGNTAPGILMGYPDRSCALSGANCVSAAGWEHCTRDTNGISRQNLRRIWC